MTPPKPEYLKPSDIAEQVMQMALDEVNRAISSKTRNDAITQNQVLLTFPNGTGWVDVYENGFIRICAQGPTVPSYSNPGKYGASCAELRYNTNGGMAPERMYNDLRSRILEYRQVMAACDLSYVLAPKA